MVAKFDGAHFRLWLADELRARRMSQRMLAARSNVDHSTISRLLASGRTPSTETMVALAAALGAELPAYLAPVAVDSVALDTRIRHALTGLGVRADVVDEMLAVYRRSRLATTRAEGTG